MKKIHCDVLVIGAGAAGSRVAYEAKRIAPELEVLLVCNGNCQFSGSTNLDASEALGINAPFNYMNDGDSEHIYFKDILNTGDCLANPELCRVIANESCDRLDELMELGVEFEENKGIPVQKKLSGCTRARSLTSGGATGINITNALSRAYLKIGVKVIENAHMLTLMQNEEKTVCGAIGLIEGKLASIHSKVVVLATGGAGQLFAKNINPMDIDGDGWAMAFKAGAKMTNMEFFQIGPAVVNPKINFIIHSHVWRMLPRLTNSKEEVFLSNYCQSTASIEEVLHLKAMSYPFSVRTDAKFVDIAIFKEIMQGNGTLNGGIYFDLTHIPREIFLQKAPITYERVLDSGIDLATDRIEIGLVVQNFNGGILIDSNGFTGVSGLYAAGEVTGGVHGSDRPGGNNLTDTQVFGYRAGINAAMQARKTKKVEITNIQKDILLRMEVNEIDKKIIEDSKKLFYKNLTVVRTAQGLSEVIEYANYYLEKNINPVVENRLLVGKMLASAMLLREESRGTHYREDFPKRSDDWSKRIVIHQDEKHQIAMETEKLTEKAVIG